MNPAPSSRRRRHSTDGSPPRKTPPTRRRRAPPQTAPPLSPWSTQSLGSLDTEATSETLSSHGSSSGSANHSMVTAPGRSSSSTRPPASSVADARVVRPVVCHPPQMEDTQRPSPPPPPPPPPLLVSAGSRSCSGDSSMVSSTRTAMRKELNNHGTRSIRVSRSSSRSNSSGHNTSAPSGLERHNHPNLPTAVGSNKNNNNKNTARTGLPSEDVSTPDLPNGVGSLSKPTTTATKTLVSAPDESSSSVSASVSPSSSPNTRGSELESVEVVLHAMEAELEAARRSTKRPQAKRRPELTPPPRRRRPMDVDAFIEPATVDSFLETAWTSTNGTAPSRPTRVPPPAVSVVSTPSMPTPPLRTPSQQAALQAVLPDENDPEDEKDHSKDAALLEKEDCTHSDPTTTTTTTTTTILVPPRHHRRRQPPGYTDSCDDALKKLYSLNELADDELGAAVVPSLRRQGSSTPGAFRAGGTSGGGGRHVVSAAATSTSNHHNHPTVGHRDDDHTRTEEQDTPSSPPTTMPQEPCTLVSATLVRSSSDDSSASASGSRSHSTDTPKHLVLAHAEPVPNQRRRLVGCIACWTLLAVAVVCASVAVALRVTCVTGHTSTYCTSANTADEKPVHATTAALPTPSPTPVRRAPVAAQRTANHAVLWGKVSTCDDVAFVVENDLEVQCGGVLRVLEEDNADCREVFLTVIGGGKVTDASKVVCKLRPPVPSNATNLDSNATVVYQETIATVLFSCEGDNHVARTATASLPRMEVQNCTAAAQPPTVDGQRRQLSTSGTRVPTVSTHARAMAEVVHNGGASAFVSMGRFCRDDSNDWNLWHEIYVCEAGERMVVTPIGTLWKDGGLPFLPAPEEGEEDSSATLDGLLNLVGLLTGGGGRNRRHLTEHIRRRQSDWDNSVESIRNIVDLESFCYNSDTCAIELDQECTGNSTICNTTNAVCSLQLEPVRISDYDTRQGCSSKPEDSPSIELMWDQVYDELSSQMFTDNIYPDLFDVVP